MNSKAFNYTVVIMGPVYGAQASYCAYQFCQSLLQHSLHHLTSIFFYADGTYNANGFTNPANDEFDLIKAWQNLAQEYKVQLSVCIAAAQRRGIIDEQSDNNIAEKFTLVGLGELSESIANSDRTVQF